MMIDCLAQHATEQCIVVTLLIRIHMRIGGIEYCYDVTCN
jgi:hypothetical protein